MHTKNKPTMFGTFLGLTVRGATGIAVKRIDDFLGTPHPQVPLEHEDAVVMYVELERSSFQSRE